MALTRATGKAPANPSLKHVRLGDYIDPAKAIVPPAEYGHEALIKSWPMYGNDTLGDCAFAGAYHEHMLWNAETGSPFTATDPTVIAAYSKYTGYNLDGVDMAQLTSDLAVLNKQ